MSHRELPLEDGHESLSHSRRTTFRRCRRLYWYQYEAGIQLKELAAPLRMGGIYSDGLEHADPEVVSAAYNLLIAEALDNGNPYLADTYLDELAVVKPMVQTYISHVMIPDAKREIEFVGITSFGFQDNGRLDGLRVPEPVDVIDIIENKLKARFGRAEIEALPLDDQLTSYFNAVQMMFGVAADAMKGRYEVAKKPGLRQTQKETRPAFRARVTADILSRPEFYHVVVEDITRTQAQIDEWKILFTRMTEDITDERDRAANGDPSAWPKNPDSCADYGGCPYAQICWAGSAEEVERVIETKFKVDRPETTTEGNDNG